jgi:multimeric flavodoxin WrbA
MASGHREDDMKILGICATHASKRPSTSMFLLEEALKAAETKGAETEAIRLSDYTIVPCTGCSTCMMFKPCPLLKNEHDQMKELFGKMTAADAFIFSYPTYALLPPSILINFFDRLSPEEDMSSEYKIYNMDQIPWVKGKYFVHKKVGIISCAAGTAAENAAAVMGPLFRAMRASVVAVASIQMMEYDQGPHIIKSPIHKDIENADFAIKMAQGVGERVVTGSVVFDETYKYEQNVEAIIKLANSRGSLC